jgi:hypothetical protein
MNSTAVEQFRRLVLDHPAARARLFRSGEPTEFVPSVLDVAHGFGLELSADDVVTAMHQALRANETRWTPGQGGQDKYGHIGQRHIDRGHIDGGHVDGGHVDGGHVDGGHAGRPSEDAGPGPLPRSPANSLKGWTPITVRWHGGQPVVHWCFTEGVDFTDPFFDQTIRRCLSDPYRLLFWQPRSLSELVAWAPSHPGLEPAGFIFHASRCGSTLVAQMFAGLASTLVLSEPAPLDQVLRWRRQQPDLGDEPDLEEDEVAGWLRAVVSGLGQPRRPTQKQLIIKLDAWAVFWWPLVRRAFPATPSIFLYREPSEIVASHLARRGSHMVPGFLPPELLVEGEFHNLGHSDGLDEEMARQPPERYCATVLAALFRAALAVARRGQMHLCHYRELPGLVPERLVPLFGVDPGPEGPARFAEAASRDSGNPLLPFTRGRSPSESVTPSVQAAVEEIAGPAYASLETWRTGGSRTGQPGDRFLAVPVLPRP